MSRKFKREKEQDEKEFEVKQKELKQNLERLEQIPQENSEIEYNKEKLKLFYALAKKEKELLIHDYSIRISNMLPINNYWKWETNPEWLLLQEDLLKIKQELIRQEVKDMEISYSKTINNYEMVLARNNEQMENILKRTKEWKDRLKVLAGKLGREMSEEDDKAVDVKELVK